MFGCPCHQFQLIFSPSLRNNWLIFLNNPTLCWLVTVYRGNIRSKCWQNSFCVTWNIPRKCIQLCLLKQTYLLYQKLNIFQNIEWCWEKKSEEIRTRWCRYSISERTCRLANEEESWSMSMMIGKSSSIHFLISKPLTWQGRCKRTNQIWENLIIHVTLSQSDI